jgi:hypothetical protein
VSRCVSDLNLKPHLDDDKQGNGVDAVEQSEGINAYVNSSRVNEDQEFKGGSDLEDKRAFKQSASYQDL